MHTYSLYEVKHALGSKIERKLRVKIGGPHRTGKVTVDKSQEDIAVGSTVTRVKACTERKREKERTRDEIFGVVKDRERERERERDGSCREEGRERWRKSDELVTKLRIKNTKKNEPDGKIGRAHV